MYGTQETEDLLIFVAKLGGAIDSALSDGKINLLDVDEIFGPAASAKAAFEGAVNIPKEIEDLDSEEAVHLVEVFADELELRSDLAKELSVEGLALATALITYVNKLRSIKSQN